MVDLKKWIDENCNDSKDVCYNKIDYKICTMKDGWKAVFKLVDGVLHPVIQAADEEHAISYISMIEPAVVPFTKI